ncbi:MAG: c-type cytochrome [Algoriphagus sp.]|uniref:c-type cytochrome n=1 Tax=Algoriphagus sp. TaxID=1872435 RepID=UPI002730F097|nr:c-type cytochrome [Algoriphagus sp.]MDP2042927.1 c-type cytochrome [Algoriphagus sp.]MDP3473424.1 c-type cytochrome [Algoriphagus sp.]
MKNQFKLFLSVAGLIGTVAACQSPAENIKLTETESAEATLSEFAAKAALGEHLVTIAGCHDCHTPRKMGPMGPELDMDRALSGHPSQQPIPDLDRKDLESKGVAATQGLTAWIGPWGVSFASNITSDATGIGNWTEEQFFTALRDGKSKGIKSNRQMLPPMPYEMFRHMTDEEIKAVFAYLKSTRPIDNVVPEPMPPLSASAQ